jgi:hypothetical protein
MGGVKEWEINGVMIPAINLKNAQRKYDKAQEK